MRTERADACFSFSGPDCVCTLICSDKNQLAELTSSEIFVDPSAFRSWVLHQTVHSTKREEWQNSYMLSTMTRPCMPYIHIVVFSPSVLCLLSVWVFCLNIYTWDPPLSWELMRTPWMAEETIHVTFLTQSQNISSRLIRCTKFISKAISKTILWASITLGSDGWISPDHCEKINRSSTSLALRSFQASSLAMRCVREESGKETFLCRHWGAENSGRVSMYAWRLNSKEVLAPKKKEMNSYSRAQMERLSWQERGKKSEHPSLRGFFPIKERALLHDFSRRSGRSESSRTTAIDGWQWSRKWFLEDFSELHLS